MLELSPQLPLLALLALAVASALVVRGRVVRGAALHLLDLAWLLPAASALVAAAVWCGEGLYEDESNPLPMVLLVVAALAEGACALARRPALDALDAAAAGGRGSRARSEAVRAGIALAALLGSCALGWLALELPWNPSLLQMDPSFSMVELLFILGLLVLLYLACQRRGAGMAVASCALCLVGIAQFFVTTFKLASIMPGDLLALGTAAEVSGAYTFSVDGFVALSVCCALVACGLCAFVAPSRPRSREGVFGNVMGNAIALLTAGSLAWSGLSCDLGKALDASVDYWDSVTFYREHGFIPSFLMVLQDMVIDRPEGYSDEGAAQTEARYASAYDAGEGASPRRVAAEQQFDELRPSVVCIMNESFSDLSALDGLRVGYTGPAFYNSWPGTALRGDLSVSIQGGGTCNTEFEFLTGTSLAFVGSGIYPYTIYDLSKVESLPKQFAELGYETTAVHPHLATNWNRSSAYEALGFDEFIDIDSFKGVDGVTYYHNGVSDASTYDKILEILREGDDPQFVFGVTMQNHGGYNTGNIPADQLRNYAPEGLDAATTASLNEYLACIDASDRDLQYFVEQLSALGRPVVLVFFGDHQPGFTPAIADAFYPGEDDFSRAVRVYEATYAVWTNYPLATGVAEGTTGDGAAAAGDGSVADGAATSDGVAVDGTAGDAVAAGDGAAVESTAPQTIWDNTSPAYLAAMTLDVIGGPLTNYQKAQLVVRSQVPALSGIGTCLADGSWIERGEDDALLPQAYDDLAEMTYLEFARKVE